jgi:hypothetical protein
MSDRLKRLAFRPKILAYHGEVFTVHRMKSHDQYDVAGDLGPFRQEPAERPLRTERCARASSSGPALRIRTLQLPTVEAC